MSSPLPYKDKMQDLRRKLTDEQKEEIRAMFKRPDRPSMRGFAKLYGVDKRTIQFIIYPERLKAFQAMRNAQKPWLKFYNKDTRPETMRKHRERKRRLGLQPLKTAPRKHKDHGIDL